MLSPHLVACHAWCSDEADIALLKAHDVKVSHNPESNMKLASGVAPVPDLLAAGVCVGLGTDGCASNNNLDLFCEMDTAAKLHKVHRLDPTVMDAATVLRMATVTGPARSGWRSHGIARAGKTRRPHRRRHPPAPPDPHVPSGFASGLRRAGQRRGTVVIDGRVVVEDGSILTFDVEAAMDAVNRIARRIGTGAEPGGPMYDTLIQNALILTGNPACEVVPAGWLGVRGATIAALGRMPAPAGAAQVIDAGGGILMPGLVNTHTHLPMTLFRGLADDLPLERWLREHIFPAEAAVSTRDRPQRRTARRRGDAPVRDTTCADGYFHEDAVAEAVEAVGLRAVLARG